MPVVTSPAPQGPGLVTPRIGRIGTAVGVLLCALALPWGTAGAAAATPDPARVGLFGSQDPTYDGAYRQSLALLALAAADVQPPADAVRWLQQQQCPDGGWQAFRPDLDAPCTAPDSVAYAGQDVNSTGLAVQALVAVGDDAGAAAGLAWLAAHQSADGGWAYYPDGAPGNASDANSTALALSAFSAAGVPAPRAPGGAGPLDALLGLQVGCAGAAAEQGAFTFFGSANDYATVQATLAAAGGSLPVEAGSLSDDAPTLTCPASPAATAPDADAAAGYLVRRLQANAGVIPDPFSADAVDYGTTANAVIALAATGHGATAARTALAALADDVDAYATKDGADLPGALAVLTLAGVALDADPADFGGTDLPTRLVATLTAAPTASPSPSVSASAAPTASGTPTADPSDAAELADTGSGTSPGASALAGGALLAAGACLVALARRGARST
jgi:hypothetical protein